jgi:hypothetical protein
MTKKRVPGSGVAPPRLGNVPAFGAVVQPREAPNCTDSESPRRHGRRVVASTTQPDDDHDRLRLHLPKAREKPSTPTDDSEAAAPQAS